MLLTKFIPKSCIAAEIAGRTKADALRELTELLLRRRKLGPKLGALDEILAREALESTGIGRGIAVPHARLPGLEQLACALGRVPDGVDFKAVDKEPVHLIFLICYPPAQQTTYLNFVATVARLLRDDLFVPAMVGAGSPAAIFETLEKHSQALVEPERDPSPRDTEGPPQPDDVRGIGFDVVLLARLELCTDMLASARSGKKQIQRRVENISALLPPEIVEQFHRIKKRKGRALVPAEGGTCQGCFMQLPTLLTQELRRRRHLGGHCPHCNRFVYAV